MSNYQLNVPTAQSVQRRAATERDDLAGLRRTVSAQVDATAAALKEPKLQWALNGVWNKEVAVQIQSTQMRAAAAVQTLTDIINLHLQKQAEMVVQTAQAADNMPADMNTVTDRKKVGP